MTLPSETGECKDTTKQQSETMEQAPFITSIRIRQVLIRNKKHLDIYYEAIKSAMLRQLEHALAVESENYDCSPYASRKVDIDITPIVSVIKRLSRQKQQKDKHKYIAEFLELQLLHAKAMKTGDYKLSPYHQANNDRVNQLHGQIDSNLIRNISNKLHYFSSKYEDSPIGDSVFIIKDIQDMFLDGTRGWNLTINESDIQNIIISETEYQSSEEEIESEDSETGIYPTSGEELDTDTEILANKNNESKNLLIKEKIDNESKELVTKEKINQHHPEANVLVKDDKQEQEYLAQQSFIINEQEKQILELNSDLNRYREYTTNLQQEIKEKEKLLIQLKLEMESQIASLQDENKALITENLQLKEKHQNNQKLITNKQQEIKNKTEKIENLHKELSLAKQQAENKKQTDKGTSTIKTISKDKNIQTQYKKDDKEIQVNTIEVIQEDNSLNITQMIEEADKSYVPSREINEDPAILIRCREDSYVPIVKEAVNEILNNQNITPLIHSRLARNRRTVIIKSSTSDNLIKLHKTLKNNGKIGKQAEIIYKKNKTNRLIVTGIPVNINETQIIQHINEQYQTNSFNNIINICKIKNNKASNYYQIVIETDLNTTAKILNKGFLQIGNRRCNITIYKPVIRCSNCQLYGHGTLSCRRKSICAFCAHGHHTNNCTNISKPELVNCTNCLERVGYVPHAANSSNCPVFIEQLKYRNNLTKSTNINFMNFHMNSYMNSTINTSGLGLSINPFDSYTYYNNSMTSA